MPRPSTLRLARAESLAHSEDKENAPPPAAPQPFSKDPFGAPRAVGPLGTLAGPAHDSDSPTSVFDAGSAHVLPTYDACGRFGEGGSADGASVADSGDGGSDGDGVGEVMDARQWMGEVDGGGVDDVDVEAAEAATPDRVRPLRPVSAPAVRSPLMDITQSVVGEEAALRSERARERRLAARRKKVLSERIASRPPLRMSMR